MDPGRGLILLAIIVALVVPATFARNQWQKYQTTVKAAETTVDNLAHSLDEHAARTFESIDSYLRTMALLLRDDRMAANHGLIQTALRDQVDALPHVIHLVVADATGRMIHGSSPAAIQGVQVTDRDYFQAQREGTGAGLFIGKPVVGRLSGKWVTPVSRRISKPDGSFGGIVLAAVDLDAFRSFYSALDVGAAGSFTLFRTDGVLMVRQPFDPAMLARDFSNGPILKLSRDKPVGVVWAAPATDGVPRVNGYRVLAKYPLLVSASLSQQEVLGPWKRAALIEGTIGLLGTGLLSLALLLFARSSRERLLAKAAAETAQQEAERANRAKTEFLAAMSHEIRTPLNSIIGFGDLLLEGTLPPGEQRHARYVRDAAQSLLGIVNDVLDFAKVEEGKIEFECIPFSVRDLAESVASILRKSASDKGIRLDIAIAPTVPAFVAGDPARIRQVFTNLIGNAIKFTVRGGVHLTMTTVPGKPDRLRFAISDSGIGIPADKLSILFERFTQVETSTTRKYGGTGLGLAISKRLVEGMGGEILVRSEEGRGSTFSFELTLPEAEAPGIQESADEQHGLPPMRLLLVDDVMLNRELVVSLLAGGHHTVETAENGAEAVQKVQTRPYDAVLMDIQMPVMDGYEATGAIRALIGPQSQVPILALTANALPASVARCEAAGMNGYISKPVTRSALAKALAPWAPPAETVEANNTARGDYAELARALREEMPPGLVERFGADLLARLDLIEGNSLSRPDLRAEAHRLVSTAGQLGFIELSEECRALEGACEDASIVDLTANRHRVVRAGQSVRRELNGVLGKTIAA